MSRPPEAGTIDAAREGDLLLSSAVRRADGHPRFVVPIPGRYRSDPGIAYLVDHETRFGGFEYPTRRFLDCHLRDGDVFVDVGAHWGVYALTAATCAASPGIDVVAIEPHPDNVERLRAALAASGCEQRVTVVCAAAGAQRGTAALLPGGTMGHRLAEAQRGGPGIPLVEVVRVDDVLAEHPALRDRRVVLKIDVEGHEGEVLRGASRLVEAGRVPIVIWEKGAAYDEQPGLDALHAVLDYLSAQGYRHWRFAHENEGGPLLPFVPDDMRCNVFSVLDEVTLREVYDKPPGPSAPPVPRAPARGCGGCGPQTPEPAARTGRTDWERWSNPGSLEAAWEARARLAADRVPAGAAVLDLGCGAMTLERHLPAGCQYLPCDLVARDERTTVCELNEGRYPDAVAARADVIAVLGVLEYVHDVPAFFARLAAWGRRVILSYSPREYLTGDRRRALGWVNELDVETLYAGLADAGFDVVRAERIDALQVLLTLVPGAAGPSPAPREVLVLSYDNVGNFGDRLGQHVLAGLLPANSVVTRAHFRPWDAPPGPVDLLILGIGNSLFAPILSDELQALIERSRASIGIFGTQYRAALPRARLDAVLDRLTHWYARSLEDALLYGRGRDNVTVLGDWLVTAMPMARGRDERLLEVGDEIWGELPLDRTIQRIQSHRRVFSSRLHPLLCALTSAEQVAFTEQRDTGAEPSGKFRSLLIDVFGRTFAESAFFDVDRDAVQRYKARVARRVQRLGAHLADLLG